VKQQGIASLIQISKKTGPAFINAYHG